jgi:two-component system, NtrC family, response regulator AtoC
VITETTITDDGQVGGAEGGGFHLLVMSPEFFASHELPQAGVVTIGRSHKSTVLVEDPVASRDHARIAIGSKDGVITLSVEDTGSANGTRVRDVEIPRGLPTPIVPGETILVGSTVIMVVPTRPHAGPRRMWLHTYFQARLDDECARAAETKTPFALVRLRFSGAAPWFKVWPVLMRNLMSPNGVAAYGPKDYELLILGASVVEAGSLLERLATEFRAEGLEARWALAWYPQNGLTGEALMSFANTSLKGPTGRPPSSEGISTDSAAMRRVREMAARVASSALSVIIQGETGVGKDVLARLIHQTSPRAQKPFLALNCAGLSETLLESELFGHVKGAFTGATGAKKGLFECAEGGTVFLDEIGDMPLSVQARLLRVIETREVRPLGAVESHSVNVRFLAATHKDLDAAIENGTFRQDLRFRLDGMTLTVPALRDRVDEIPTLAQTFLAEAAREMARAPAPAISEAAFAALAGHEWKGNIRELKNVVERALVLCDGNEILPEHLDLQPPTSSPGRSLRGETTSRLRTLEATAMPWAGDPTLVAERRRIEEALSDQAGNQTRAAKLLGISRRTLVAKLDLFQFPRPQKRSDLEEPPGEPVDELDGVD